MSTAVFRELGNLLAKASSKGGSAPKARPDPEEDSEGDQSGPGLRGIHGETPLETSFGAMPAKFVRRGDPLRVGPDDYLPVVSVRSYHLESEVLRQHPEAMPVVLEARTAYANLAKGSVIVAPGQRVLVRDDLAPTKGRLTVARDIRAPIGAARVPEETLTYYRFEFERPVCFNGGGYWLEA